MKLTIQSRLMKGLRTRETIGLLPPCAFMVRTKTTLTLILIMKDKEMHYFSNLFHKVLYIFRTSPLSIIRSISRTVYTARGICYSNFVGVWYQTPTELA